MYTLNWSSSYKRAFKKATKNESDVKEKILLAMEQIQNNPFDPKLKTHKLKGVLDGAWACSVEYDLRIILDFVKNNTTGETEILLIDIGSHEEVY